MLAAIDQDRSIYSRNNAVAAMARNERVGFRAAWVSLSLRKWNQRNCVRTTFFLFDLYARNPLPSLEQCETLSYTVFIQIKKHLCIHDF